MPPAIGRRVGRLNRRRKDRTRTRMSLEKRRRRMTQPNNWRRLKRVSRSTRVDSLMIFFASTPKGLSYGS
ncbi:unnamed protein product [Dibothriocephalus latus]|uniref:Uncharacterized protein n=1 Tax=Dibothriocephalus latus TaxID=60516 RepID=A0A3P7QYN0_DIBLA|nr:unnamed protein product [Dibothriocephalus latus]